MKKYISKTFKFDWSNDTYALTDKDVRVYSVLATVMFAIYGDHTYIDELHVDISYNGRFIFKLPDNQITEIEAEARKRADSLTWAGDFH